MYVILAWSSISRSGDRGAGAQNDSVDGHRGSVRGQILLPRRESDSTA